ncbi:MAG: hypothetical protein Q9M25_04815 [Mariprofundaceae bacterium]|nr:hypothetical protein [Mariprofundaceae bacterium]
MLLQDALDGFVRTQATHSTDHGKVAEACMEHLAYYLLGYSDLFDDDIVESEESPLAEWEQSLDSHMSELMDGDTEPPLSLYDLKLEQLEPSHLRDFFGWYLPREQGGDAAAIVEYAAVMRDWLQFLCRKGRLENAQHMAFLLVLAEIEPDAVRVAKAARMLFHFARLGHGTPGHAHGTPFSHFAEGHARIAEIVEDSLWLRFDSQPDRLGPLVLSVNIVNLLRIGDVLDVELGLRGDAWAIVDIGPVYPESVYVEAEEFESLVKIT